MSDDLLDDLDAIDGILTTSGGNPDDTMDEDTDVSDADAVTVDEDDETHVAEPFEGVIEEVDQPSKGSSPRTSFPVKPADESAETTPRGQSRLPRVSRNSPPQRKGPGPPPANRSGAHPAAQSGAHPAAQSGAHPAAQSGAHPAAQSGAHPAAQSGAHPAAQSGAHPAAQSGAHPTANRSGAYPAAQSGAHPAAQSGAHPTANRSGAQRTPTGGHVPDLGGKGPSTSGEFAAKSEDFYSLPTGHTGMLPAVEEKSGPTKRTFGQTFVRGVFVALPVGLIAAAAVAYFCVARWLSPSEAMLWTVLGACCPALFASIVVTWPAEGQRNSVGAWIAGMVPGLAAGGVALLIPFGWAAPDVREQTLEYVPDDASILTRVWSEKDTDLSVYACKKMLEHSEDPDWRMSVLANLTLHPASTATCLNELEDEEQRERVVETVLDRWQKDLLAEAEGTDGVRACQIAQSMSELPTDRKNIDSRLLTCTLTAPNLEAQACCGRILASSVKSHDDMIARIREGLDALSGREAAGNLLSMAFHKNNLTQPQKQLSRKMKFSSRAAGVATLKLACESLEDNLDPGTVRHMTASLPKMCGVSQARAPSSVDSWLLVCDKTLATLETDDIIAPDEALCHAAESAFSELAVASASRFLAHAVRSNQRSGLGRQIDLGYEREVAAIKDQDDLMDRMQKQRQLIASGMSPQKAAEKAGISASTMQAIAAEGRPTRAPSKEGIGKILGHAFGESGLSEKQVSKLRKQAEGLGIQAESVEAPEKPPGVEE